MSEKVKRVRKEGLDKFYTKPEIVDKCLSHFSETEWEEWDLIVEPSAGNGSFLLKIPSKNKIGLDISPEHPDIIKKNFFEFVPTFTLCDEKSEDESDKRKILVIGNPPFGRVSSLAIKFFNHAAKWCDVIAFIIPRTFRRISVQNKLDKNFHLLLDEEIPTNPCSFYPKMMVKCCFQVWEKRDYERKIIKLKTTHPHFNFLSFGPKDDKGQPTPPTTADFAIRAYGGECGEIKTQNLNKLRPKSWHWIKCNIEKEVLINRFSKLNYSISLNTARQNSIGKGELVSLYQSFIDNINNSFIDNITNSVQ